MSAPRRDRGPLAAVAVGGAACAACCAAPVIGFVAALGVGGALAFGGIALALIVGVVFTAIAVVRRRRRQAACTVATPVAGSQPVTLGPRR